MSYVAKGDKEFEASGAGAAKSHKIRITLTSRNVKNLEKGKSDFLHSSNSLARVAPLLGSPWWSMERWGRLRVTVGDRRGAVKGEQVETRGDMRITT